MRRSFTEGENLDIFNDLKFQAGSDEDIHHCTVIGRLTDVANKIFVPNAKT